MSGNMNQTACCLVALGVVLCAAGLAARVDAATQTSRILIITGEDWSGHHWQETTPALRDAIENDGRMTVDVLDDLAKLATIDLSPYAAVVLHFKNYDANVPGREGFDSVRRFVERGGGLVLVHFACGAFEEFKDEFAPLAGRVWFGINPPEGRHQHDPYGEFVVEMTDVDHAITRGMESFSTFDELYTCLEGETPITTLAQATSVVDGKVYPVAFVLPFGKGRVFHCALGHDVRSFESAGVAAIFRRGTAGSLWGQAGIRH